MVAKTSPYGVQLEDGSWSYIQKILHEGRSDEIKNSNSFLVQLEYTPNNELHTFFKEETIEAALSDREPEYLKTISEKSKIKIQDFLKKKEGTSKTIEEYQKLAYSVLITMHVYLDQASQVASDLANYFSDNGTAKRSSSQLSSNSSLYASTSSTRLTTGGLAHFRVFFDAEDATTNTVKPDAYNRFSNNKLNTPNSAGHAIRRGNMRSSLKDLNITDPVEIGKLTFRFAEKITLLYFLKNADKIINASSEAVLKRLETIPNDNIFASIEIWNQFKDERIIFNYGLQDFRDHEAYHFVKPWIDELDRIVEIIESKS